MVSDSYKRILIIRLSSLGDILLTTPMLRALRNTYSSAVIDYCIRNEYSNAIEFNPHINTILSYTKDDAAIDKLKKQIKAGSYDLIIDLQNNLRSSSLLSGLKTKILKFDKKGMEKFLLVNFKINMMRNLPTIPERYAKTLPGLLLDEEGLELHYPGTIVSDLPETGNLIGFCPGSRHYTKMWPHEYFNDLGEILTLHGYKIVMLGGQQDYPVCNLISSGIQGTINKCNDNDLYATAAHMKKCLAIVANDSGLMHVACAAKVPVITIFGSTVKEFGFVPYKNKSEVVENNLVACRPCSHFGRDKCPKRHFNCMMKTTPAMLYQRLTAFLPR